MTSTLLLEALEMLLARGDHDDQKQKEIIEAIAEIRELDYRYKASGDADIWHDEVTVIAENDLCDILNNMKYDFYGEMYRANNNQPVSREAFIEKLRSNWLSIDGVTHFTDNQLTAGWEVINDLYQDNEATGDHDAKGHFIMESLLTIGDMLDRLKEFEDSVCAVCDDQTAVDALCAQPIHVVFNKQAVDVPIDADTCTILKDLLEAGI